MVRTTLNHLFGVLPAAATAAVCWRQRSSAASLPLKSDVRVLCFLEQGDRHHCLQSRSFTISTLTRRSTMPLLYPSILFQERMLGFALGGLVGMGVFVYEQREIWKSTAGLAETLSGGILPPPRGVPSPPILGREVRDDLAHVWNATIDKTFGSLIHTLSSKGW